MRHLSLAWILPAALVSAIAFNISSPSAQGQTPTSGNGGSLTINSDVQEANSKTGVFTARGNVQIYYPARQIQATAAQAQYFSKERKIILNGNVYVLQEGNSIKGESVTYLIDEGRFIATPKAKAQVESIYIVSDPNPATGPSPAPNTPSFNPKVPASTPATPKK